MSTQSPKSGSAIFWFRQDLRLVDNPALLESLKHQRVLPIFILDDINSKPHQMGGASRWWLHHSLTSLDKSLGGKLSIYCGCPLKIIPEIIRKNKVSSVYWNRCYEPWQTKRDSELKKLLTGEGISTQSMNGSLLWEAWDIKKNDGSYYKVFTPFYRNGCLSAPPPRLPHAKPASLDSLARNNDSLEISDLKLLPKIRWDESLEKHWSPGERGALHNLYTFIENGISNYKEGRNFPAEAYTSRLSPHLHFGEISPNQVWYSAISRGSNPNTEHFLSELGWREFSHHLLYHIPDMPTQNMQSKFNNFPWRSDDASLKAWQLGQTGYPIVDAGMRELWQTGYMHNRVRMIVGSFLVKNLLLDWRHGERWFWDTLVDADLANNSASWQWVAGCGTDAAPYFRIFNPVTQGEKFDSAGRYTRRFVPELAALPDKYLFKPWQAPAAILEKAGVKLGQNYPLPIVDVASSRELALKAFASLRN